MRTALVVGLLPGQAQRVRHALRAHPLRLRFATSDQAKHVRAAADVNLLMIDYINHGAQERLARLLQPGQTLHPVRGLHKNAIALLESLTCPPST